MRHIVLPINVVPSTAPRNDAHYEFYKIDTNWTNNTVYTVAWIKWGIDKKGWHKRAPIEIGIGAPNDEFNKEAYLVNIRNLYKPITYDYHLNLIINEDYSGQLEINEITDVKYCGQSGIDTLQINEDVVIAFSEGTFNDPKINLPIDLFKAVLERDKEISEVSESIERDEATQDDLWDAMFPSIKFCEIEIKRLGFEPISVDPNPHYDFLYSAVHVDKTKTDPLHNVYRNTRSEIDRLEHNQKETLITALHYRNAYKESDGDRVYFGEWIRNRIKKGKRHENL